jgi:DNA-binding MarR family transcriptional regulator
MDASLLTPENYRLPIALGYLLHRNARSILALAEKAFADDAELNFRQFIALLMVRDSIACTPGAIAREIGISTSSITKIIDCLEERDFARRRRSNIDRRSIFLTVTPAGTAVIQELLPRLTAIWTTLLGDFTVDDYATLVTLHQKLQRAIDEA